MGATSPKSAPVPISSIIPQFRLEFKPWEISKRGIFQTERFTSEGDFSTGEFSCSPLTNGALMVE